MRREKMNQFLRTSLMRVGYHGKALSERKLDGIHNYLSLGIWARSIGGTLPKNMFNRFELHQMMIDMVTGEKPLYLEFGVHEGKSFRFWCEKLDTPGARFVGFDSFEGLPEDWNEHAKKGYFAVDGVPVIDDERASLQVGWFQDTLPKFDLPEYDQLVVNIDSDLYSSAVFVLEHLEDVLVPGVIIYFDELHDREHELRAFQQFLERTGKKVEILGVSSGGVQWVFKFV